MQQTVCVIVEIQQPLLFDKTVVFSTAGLDSFCDRLIANQTIYGAISNNLVPVLVVLRVVQFLEHSPKTTANFASCISPILT
jgi:hypothetical protein